MSYWQMCRSPSSPVNQVPGCKTTLVTGTVQPLFPMAPVEIQQQNPDLTSWTVVATGTVADDGSFWLDMDYFNYCQGLTMTSGRFHELFGGPPRQPDSTLEARHALYRQGQAIEADAGAAPL